jgi:hypothetical protein
MSSTLPWNLSQLTIQNHSQTSTGSSTSSLIDRDSGREIFVQYSSFDIRMSASPLSLKADWSDWSAGKLATFLKYLLAFQSLPESALEEAVDELEKVVDFYADRASPAQLPATTKQVVGRINSIQVRPPIVLES